MEHHLYPPSAPNGDRAHESRFIPGFILPSFLPYTPDQRRSPADTQASSIAPRHGAATISASGGHEQRSLLSLRLLACLAVLVLGLSLFPRAAAELPLRPEISAVPQQTPVQNRVPWKRGDYRMKPLAEYDVTARVLSARSYQSAREAEVSPVDLALGWGTMGDREFLTQLDVKQRDRWYFVRWRNVPVKAQDVIANSANTHMIPATPELAAQLQAVQPGDVVRLKGYLVEVSAEDGWSWRSSTERTDTGDGSCEVLWVESIEVYADEPITYAAVD